MEAVFQMAGCSSSRDASVTAMTGSSDTGVSWDICNTWQYGKKKDKIKYSEGLKLISGVGMAETLAGWDALVWHSCSSAGVPFALCARAFLVVDHQESSFRLSELSVPDSISAQPPDHGRCCSFKAPAEQQQLLGLQLNSTSHEMRDNEKSAEREKAEASETIRHLKAVWDSRKWKKGKRKVLQPSAGGRREVCAAPSHGAARLTRCRRELTFI